jgi:hypothetical protein
MGFDSSHLQPFYMSHFLFLFISLKDEIQTCVRNMLTETCTYLFRSKTKTTSLARDELDFRGSCINSWK